MTFLEGLALLLVLVIRAFALWIVFPVAFLAWTLFHRWAQADVGQAITWYDPNFIAFLTSVPFRFLLFREHRTRFLGYRE